MAGTFTLGGQSQGLLSGGATYGPLSIQGTSVVGERFPATLASGANTFTVPTGALAIAIAFSAQNTGTMTFKTNLNSGDSGDVMNAVGGFFVQPLAPGTTSIILTGSGLILEICFI